jgi:hypothetical protein
MSDSEIIWYFLTTELYDEHPIVYIYCAGQQRSKTTAIEKAMKTLLPIFNPPYEPYFIKQILVAYLDYKKRQYSRAEISLKSIY